MTSELTSMQVLMGISAAGLQAQGKRIRTIAENIANANTTGLTPGAEPYQRKIPTFKQALDKELGVRVVRAGDPAADTSDFPTRYDPSHPAANEQGYVLLPNVKPIMETMDLREAQRSYEANLTVIEQTRAMMSKTIDMIRG